MTATLFRVGTRGSALALTQAGAVARALAAAVPGLDVELVTIRSAGDEPAPARILMDKSRFVGALEDALLAGEIDLAVHSAKDLPGTLPEGLRIAAVPAREEPRDAICGAASLVALAPGSVIGTASLRRRAQLLAARPDLKVVDVRGNVDTRLRRLEAGAHDAIVLAAAGLSRLGLPPGTPLPTEVCLPAPGQGCLALEARADDAHAARVARAVDDVGARGQLVAERALARELGAGCDTSVGALARPLGGELMLSAFVGRPDGAVHLRASAVGRAAEPERLGQTVAATLLAHGAAALLEAEPPRDRRTA